MKNILFVFIFLSFFYSEIRASPVVIKSPDDRLEMRIFVEAGQLSYAVNYKGKPVMPNSGLGISFNGKEWNNQLILKDIETSRTDTVWHPLYGERSAVRDQFNEKRLMLAWKGVLRAKYS